MNILLNKKLNKRQSSKKEVDIKMTLEDIYGKDDLSSWELFAGNFINFGYWNNRELRKDHLSKQDRINSSVRLYKKLFSKLRPIPSDIVVEVGCGLGEGVFLLKDQVKSIIGIDASISQIQRCYDKFPFEKHKLQFAHGIAESLPFPQESVDKIFSLEAIQHFSSIDSFLESSFKTLKKKDGKIVLASFLFNSAPKKINIKGMTTFENKIDNIILKEYLERSLLKTGFKNIYFHSIGSHVWSGFDKWISQTTYKESWNRNWLNLYRKEILDYYIIEASK